jgi:hypothetical protein
VREAVDLAMSGHWEEAATANRLVVAASPNDIDAFDGQGKSQLGLRGSIAARAAFQH